MTATFVPDRLTDLTDTPSSYTGKAFNHTRVNSGATALEFYDPSVVDIRDHGAVSGQDSGAAINSALTAASAGAGRLFIPEGTWWAETSIVPQNNVYVFGCGPKSIIKAKASLNAAVIAGSSNSCIVFDNFAIDGNMANQSVNQARGITLNACTNIDVKNLFITKCFGHAIWTQSASSYIRILDNYIYDTGSASITPANTGRAIYAYQSSKVTMARNRIRAADGFGITVQETPETLVMDNTIEDSTYYDGMIIYNSDRVSVVNNTIKNVKDSGIVFELCDYFTCTGNLIQEAGYVGLYFAGSSHGTVTANVFKDNGQNNHATYRHDIILTRSSTTPATHNIVNANICIATAAIKARYGVQEEYSNCDYNIITSNQCIGHTVAGISTLGANTVTANNITA